MVPTPLHAARVIVGVIPAAMIVASVLLIGLLAFLCREAGRTYAVEVMGKLLALAEVIVGVELPP